MAIDDIVGSRGFRGWNNVLKGINISSLLSDRERRLIKRRTVNELTSIQREFRSSASNGASFSLSVVYSDFSRSAYEGSFALGFDPIEVLGNLPRRIKTSQESSLEKTLSTARAAEKITQLVLIPAAAVGLAIWASKFGEYLSIENKGSISAGVIGGIMGATLGYYIPKYVFKLPISYFENRLKLERASANKTFVANINRYIEQSQKPDVYS